VSIASTAPLVHALENVPMSPVSLPTSESLRLTSLLPACRAALQRLLQAHECAAELALDAWEFALEIVDLRAAGVGHSELRWLVAKGYLEHAYEGNGHDRSQRQFRPTPTLRIGTQSCFVLTATGLALARRVPGLLNARTGTSEEPGLAIPHYDADLKELRLRGELVKRFKVPAGNQELLLVAFEEQGWPAYIDDPLPPAAIDAKRRLHDTIKRLNGRHERSRLRFVGSGDGRGVRWERCPPIAHRSSPD